ncbi:LysE family translocator [Pseudolysobacter antarcticus]|uniref:LysE family translocator n=2 Tax=Pseudolysobacter antarcticus TaxID=2511995 RepID=A0A411HF08_9GAMM|nr:LysE family translocator [Pseudolysobacter antarcticus]
MMYSTHLWLFFLVVLAVVVLPGLDMAYVLGSALVGGRKPGLTAVAGIVAGGVCHVLMSALGIGIVLKLIPGAFNALLLVGALYIAWIGIAVLRSHAAFGFSANADAPSAWITFRRAALTCLMNPKAYLFMLAIFPQFVRAEYGPIWHQAIVLGAIIAFTQIAVYGSLALVASGARGWLAQRPNLGVAINRGVGIVLIAAAVITGINGWRNL